MELFVILYQLKSKMGQSLMYGVTFAEAGVASQC